MKRVISVAFVLVLTVLLTVACGSNVEEKELTFTTLDEKLQSGGNVLEYSTYKEVTKDSDKSLDIELDYTNQILTEGQTKAITNILDQEFSKKYKNIKVKIIQEAPEFDYVEFEYNGKDFERTK